MQEEQPIADSRKLQSIIATSKPSHLHIADFKIVEGHRYYKLIWRHKDGRLRFKWQPLQNLSDHMDVVYKYEMKNRQKISLIENQWVQYFLDGKVRNPYIYLDLDKMKDQFQDHYQSQDDSKDSQFSITRRYPIRKALKFMITPNIKSRKKKHLSKPKNKISNKIWENKGQDLIPHSSEPKASEEVPQSASSLLSASQNASEMVSSSSQEKQSIEQFFSHKESSSYSVLVQPQKKEQPVPEVIEMSKKRQQIMKICHDAIQKGSLAMEKAKSKALLHQSEAVLSSQLEQIQAEKKSAIEQQQFAKDISIASLEDPKSKEQSFKLPENIFTPEESSNLQNAQVQLQQISSDSSQLRSSNMRQYLKMKFQSMDIDLQKNFTPAHCNSQSRNSQKQSIYELVQYPLPKDRKQNKKTISISYLLRNLQANTTKTNLSVYEKYISANLLAYESISRGRPPKIFKINCHFSYHNLVLYSISVGNAYSNHQMFAIEATLRKVDPTLLQCYSLQNQNLT